MPLILHSLYAKWLPLSPTILYFILNDDPLKDYCGVKNHHFNTYSEQWEVRTIKSKVFMDVTVLLREELVGGNRSCVNFIK